ncbi:MAG: hypothetical protein PHI49_10475 [Halothiobacillaceae bacterium]|nr:hypothetical protein [Halothiobacillaceae bacterium]
MALTSRLFIDALAVQFSPHRPGKEMDHGRSTYSLASESPLAAKINGFRVIDFVSFNSGTLPPLWGGSSSPMVLFTKASETRLAYSGESWAMLS